MIAARSLTFPRSARPAPARRLGIDPAVGGIHSTQDGTFVERDPVDHFAGMYGYAQATPLSYTDPSGLWHKKSMLKEFEEKYKDDTQLLQTWQLLQQAGWEVAHGSSLFDDWWIDRRNRKIRISRNYWLGSERPDSNAVAQLQEAIKTSFGQAKIVTYNIYYVKCEKLRGWYTPIDGKWHKVVDVNKPHPSLGRICWQDIRQPKTDPEGEIYLAQAPLGVSLQRDNITMRGFSQDEIVAVLGPVDRPGPSATVAALGVLAFGAGLGLVFTPLIKVGVVLLVIGGALGVWEIVSFGGQQEWARRGDQKFSYGTGDRIVYLLQD